MPVDFFEKELGKIKISFNQTFGVMPLCKPKIRVRVMFAIVQMCILQQKIRKEKSKEDISRFVKTKEKLNKIFSTLIKSSEGRQHDNRTNNQKSGSYDSGNGGSGYGPLPGMRNSIQTSNSKTG